MLQLVIPLACWFAGLLAAAAAAETGLECWYSLRIF